MKSLVAALMFGAMASAALANGAPTEPEELIIEGRRLTPEELRSDAAAMIRTLSVVPWTDQYARWNTPVCPEVIGTANEMVARTLIDKIRLVAAEAGAPLGKPGCDSNVVIAFADDAGKVFSKVAARRPQIFDVVQPYEAKALRHSTLPVRWFYALQTGGSMGQQLASGDEAPGAGELPVLDFGQTTLQLYNGGRMIGMPTRANVVSAAIMIDIRHIEGTRLDALAAHVAMVALAPSRMPPKPLPVRSIANLYQGDADLTDLSAWDRAYLEALYAVPANRASTYQRAAMVGRMAKLMGAAD